MPPHPTLVVDWQRPARPRPQSSLEAYAPDLALAAARRARDEARKRPKPSPRASRQLALEEGAEAHAREVVEFDLRAASRLKSIYISDAGPPRPSHRPDEAIRDALLRACEPGASRDEAVLSAARECAVPAASLPLVEGLLDDLVLEGALAAYGEVLFAKRPAGRKVVALDVGEDDLVELLSRGHRVLELK
ncbi:MAG TPA: hypothetical protein VJ547_00580 [Candidatus Thermoplasmatota archaeon]|nr:hypothetical protein [Candidatus Thermoplasmatota archaeon]